MNVSKWCLTFVMLITFLLSGFMVACDAEPYTTSEPEPLIPGDFTTYTHEGVFSISYPSDWVPALSLIDEIWEEIKTEMMAEDPLSGLEHASILFAAGLETVDGWYPTVNIVIDRTSFGYQTVDEVDEACRRYEQKNTPGFKELSVLKTTVDGREASIIISEDNEPDFGPWRYVGMTTVYGDNVWIATCGCEA